MKRIIVPQGITAGVIQFVSGEILLTPGISHEISDENFDSLKLLVQHAELENSGIPETEPRSGDAAETVENYPKSWVAWKKEAERLQALLDSKQSADEAANEVEHDESKPDAPDAGATQEGAQKADAADQTGAGDAPEQK